MLQSLREHASSWIVKILFGFLILSFGLWGINDIFMGERDPAVAKVGGQKITYNQLNDAVRQQMARFAPLFGGSLDRDQARQLGLIDQALDTLVDRAAFANATSDYGLIVNDDMIRQHIANEPSFRNSLGQFDRYIFQQVLSQNGLNENTYIASLRRDLAAAQIMSAVAANTPAPNDLIEALHKVREETRVAETIAVPSNQAETPAVPDDATVESHYKEIIEQFMTPERRNVSYVLIDPATLMSDTPTTEDKLKQDYETRISEFTVREKRDVDQVVLKDEADAKKVSDLLGKGKSLEEATKEANVGASVVKLGWIERADLLGEIGDPAFTLKSGDHSAAIKSPLGWHILAINGIQPGSVRPFAEVRDQLRQDIAEHQAAEQAHEIAIKLEDALASGATLSEAADRAGLKVQELPAIDATGLGADGKPVPNLIKDPRFLRAVMETPQGQESQLIELPKNTFAVVRVEQITPPAAKPLDEVKNDVIASWQTEQRMAATRKRAEAIAERINKGEAVAAVAESEKLAVKTTPPFARIGEPVEGLPEALKSQLFELKIGGAAIGESNDGYVVGVLKEIKPAPPLEAAARSDLAAQVGQAIGDDLISQLITALRARYHVEVDRAIIDSRF